MDIGNIPTPHPHHKFNLAMLHGSVNLHLHCCCEVFQLVLGAYPRTGCKPLGFSKPATCTRRNPYPWVRVRVDAGRGTDSTGKPQGYPCQSLLISLSGFHSHLGFGLISHRRSEQFDWLLNVDSELTRSELISDFLPPSFYCARRRQFS